MTPWTQLPLWALHVSLRTWTRRGERLRAERVLLLKTQKPEGTMETRGVFLAPDGFDSDLGVGPQRATAAWGTPLLARKATGLCLLPVSVHPCGSVVGRAQAPAGATGAKAGAAASALNHFK